jgi:hypothetical protein
MWMRGVRVADAWVDMNEGREKERGEEANETQTRASIPRDASAGSWGQKSWLTIGRRKLGDKHTDAVSSVRG